MKNLLLLFLFASSFLTSCSTDNNGDLSINLFGWLLIFGFTILIVLLVINTNKENIILDKYQLNRADFIKAGKYVGGHPNIDKEIEHTSILKKDSKLYIISTVIINDKSLFNNPIEIDKITDITVKDSSTIEKSVTLGRVLLTGVFALAWKKKKKNEFAFVTIEWKDGKFSHTTIFNFEGKNAMNDANTLRNKLIKLV